MKSIMRIAALTALGLVAAAGIFSADTSDMMMFFVQKAVGFGAAYAPEQRSFLIMGCSFYLGGHPCFVRILSQADNLRKGIPA